MEVTVNSIISDQSFELSEHEGVLVLEPRGNFGSLDWNAHASIESEIYAALEHFALPRLVIDLTGVTYAGSEFVGMMLELRKRVRQLGGLIAVAGARSHLAEVLRTLRIDQILPQYPSLGKAIQALTS